MLHIVYDEAAVKIIWSGFYNVKKRMIVMQGRHGYAGFSVVKCGDPTTSE